MHCMVDWTKLMNDDRVIWAVYFGLAGVLRPSCVCVCIYINFFFFFFDRRGSRIHKGVMGFVLCMLGLVVLQVGFLN